MYNWRNIGRKGSAVITQERPNLQINQVEGVTQHSIILLLCRVFLDVECSWIILPRCPFYKKCRCNHDVHYRNQTCSLYHVRLPMVYEIRVVLRH